MAGVSRRSSFGSSIAPPSSSSVVKRPAAEKVVNASQQQAKKRPALRNLTNQSNVGNNSSRSSFPKVNRVLKIVFNEELPCIYSLANTLIAWDIDFSRFFLNCLSGSMISLTENIFVSQEL